MMEAADVARVGKKRKTGPRHPGGRLVAVPEIMSPAAWQRLRAQSASDAAKAHWGTAVGALFAAGKITAPQNEALARFGNLCRAWRRAEGLPPLVPGTMRVAPKSVPSGLDADAEAVWRAHEAAWEEDRDIAVIKAYERARGVMDGRQLSALHRLCEMNEPQTEDVRRRLVIPAADALVALWRID